MTYLSLRDIAAGTVHDFETDEVHVGRDPGCGLVVSGEGADVVSGFHARFFFNDGKWWVEDVGSRNGTSLNDLHVSHNQPQPVKHGSVVRLGDRGPRFRVEAIEKRAIVDTVPEFQRAARASAPTMPMEALNDSTIQVPGLNPAPPPAAPPQPPAKSPQESGIHIVVHDTRSGSRYEANGGRIRLGRGDECERRPVAPGDSSVSRVHAEIVLLPKGKAVLRDAKSRNGTFVNGKLIVGDHTLEPGERVTLGEGGPDLMVDVLVVPGVARVSSDKSTAKTVPDTGGTAPKDLRRSFQGKGKTIFFREMMEETSRRSSAKLRWVIWSFVAALTATVGVFYWYSEQRDRATTAALEQQRQTMLAQQAQEDSVRRVASADYEHLRQALDSARSSAAPSAVLDSLRQALTSASKRTEALEGALKRAEAQMAVQIAAGDSTRRVAQGELVRLRGEVSRASASAARGSSELLDSLRGAMRDAERRAQAVDAQMRGLKGLNLPALAQSAGGAVGLVTAFIGQEIYDGSGFVLTPSGYFVTNRHVAEPEGKTADSLFVTMAGQKFMVRADVASVAPAEGPDVAVIKIHGYKGPVVPHVDWSGSHVRQGEPAALIGFPAGAALALDASGKVQTSMSAGIFSKVTPERIQFDGFTVGGSSGSPIFNADGEIVALHRSGLKEAAGLGFAVPIPQLVPYLPSDAKAELGLR